VVLTDLRGYGDSGKPEGGARHENYSFRAMAQDQVEVMHHLGHETFSVASHDRGARTAHRMCLDHPQAVRKVCFMEIVPTLRMYRDTSKEFATKYMWWLVVLNTNSGQVVAKLPVVGDTDNVYFDPTRRFVYVIGGDGAVDVFQMSDPNHCEHAGRTNTASGARTGLFVPGLDRLFVAVTHHESQAAKVLVYQITKGR
jgi:pimeloyl-ACP methyl ester carboxylesterase